MIATTRRTLITAVGAGLSLSACGEGAPSVADPDALDDASGLNPTRVTADISLSTPSVSAPAAMLHWAGAKALPICIGGARHSMGGQSLPPVRGIAASLDGSAIRIASDRRRYTVPAGARWRDVLAALDPHGLSPAVTQSNNDFSVGGTLSVNAHGWAVPRGPAGDTVHSLRLMTSNGAVVTCSPRENSDLFRHVLGGYGLFGIILEAELEAVPNRLLERSHERLAASAFSDRFTEAVRRPGVNLAYGRLSPARSGFLEEAVLVTHSVAETPPEGLPPLSVAGALDGLGRRVFRAQTGSEAGKRFRWWAERHLANSDGVATRNSLMNVPLATFAGTDARRTDILHEYFVPPAALEAFLVACRRIIPASRQDLLNVTLRWLEADRRSVLAFTPAPRIALVMLFSQRKTTADEADMRRMTKALIDAALDLGGSFYLPYRLHARSDQLLRAYPGLPGFVEAKRRADPGLRFRNQMWDHWVAGL